MGRNGRERRAAGWLGGERNGDDDGERTTGNA
jgi:hypothetical protein